VVECHLAKVDVEGSNPFSRSMGQKAVRLPGLTGAALPHCPPIAQSQGIAMLRDLQARLYRIAHPLPKAKASRCCARDGKA
jgi:hypothetical protein